MPPGTEVNWGLTKPKHFDVMEETCKAKVLGWFKVPPEKRGPLVTEKDERQRAYRRGRGALSLPGPCTAACWAGHAVCLLDMHFSAFAQDGRHQQLFLPQRTWDCQGCCSSLSSGTVPVSGHRRTPTELVPCLGGTGRGTRAKESHRETKTSPSSDNGTETGQGLQGCQTKMVLIAIMHLYSNSKF